MPTQPPRKVLDVRALAHSREVVAYRGDGLFPVLANAPDGSVVAVVRGGGGHHGASGHVDIIRSRDAGTTWTLPNIVANSDCDDRNPALGVSARGTLILAYECESSHDEEGTFVRWPDDADPWPICARVTRSLDSGLTWEAPLPLSHGPLSHSFPFGKNRFPGRRHAADGGLPLAG